MFPSSELFWGSALTLYGISLLLKAFFGIDIQFFNLFFGGLLVYWGIAILLPRASSYFH